MKTTTLFFLSALFFICGLKAQTPMAFNYQAVLRDEAGQAITSEDVTLEIAILKGSPDGEEIFSETHQTQTNEFGLVNIRIGSENSLETIEWAAEDYFIEISLNGINMGTTQLLSVPFALHALTSADSFSGDYHDLTNRPEGEQPGDMMYWDGEQWVVIEQGSHGQTLTFCNGVPVWGPCDDNGDDPGNPEDYDGNVYETVVIGTKEWFSENLRSLHYSDGTPISGVSSPNNDDDMVEHYGKLYTWEAAMNGEASDNSNPGTVQGVCPAGWRLPSDAEMSQLTEYLGGVSLAGGKLKSTRTAPQDHPRWNSPNSGANNESGFTGYPAGRKNADGSTIGFGTGGYFWTSTENNASEAFGYLLYYSLTGFYKDSGTKDFGFSVRCVRELED